MKLLMVSFDIFNQHFLKICQRKAKYTNFRSNRNGNRWLISCFFLSKSLDFNLVDTRYDSILALEYTIIKSVSPATKQIHKRIVSQKLSVLVLIYLPVGKNVKKSYVRYIYSSPTPHLRNYWEGNIWPPLQQCRGRWLQNNKFNMLKFAI